MENLTPEQSARLVAAREAKNLTQEAAAHLAGVTVPELEALEHGEMIAPLFLKLCHDVYGTQMHDIFHGPYVYDTQEAWIQAFLNAEVSEGVLAQGLKTHRIDARRQVHEYQERNLDIHEREEFLKGLALQAHKEALASFFRALAVNATYLYYIRVRVQSDCKPEDYELALVGSGHVVRVRRKVVLDE